MEEQMEDPGMEQMEQGKEAEGPNDLKGSSNPVVDAIKTLMLFVSAMQEQQNPNAPALQDALQKFAQALQGNGAPEPGAKPEEEAPPEEGQPPAGPEPIKGQPQGAVKASKQVPVL